MIYRDFKGLKLSGLGMGMMRLPTVDENDAVIDEAAAEKMIDYGYNHGINYFDTAWGYHNGSSELAAGKILSKYLRESYFLATKFPGYDLSNMDKVEEIFEKQLEKCRTDYFDFYLFHNVYEGNVDAYLDRKYGILDYLLKQKENGRIRHLGFSAHGSTEVITRFLNAYGKHMEFCQLQLNYMDWHFQGCDEKVELIKKAGLPIWVMEPLRGGKLAKVSKEMEARMKEMRKDESVPAWAFRFIQAIPEVGMVLSGMSNLLQLRENIAIYETEKPLTKEEFDTLIKITDDEVEKGGLPCTSCHYCTSHCPKGLPIPELLALYNVYKPTGGVGFLVGSIPKEHQPSNCIGCRSCEQVCPQRIKISEAMSEFSSLIGM